MANQKAFLFIVFLFLTTNFVAAQDVSLMAQKSRAFSKAEQTAAWNQLPSTTYVGFATTARRFPQELPPSVPEQKAWEITAWKNEKVHVQVLISSKNELSGVTAMAGNLQNEKGNLISSEQISLGFLQYVMTDEFRGGCGYRQSKDFDSSYVADIINTDLKAVDLHKNSTQPVWIRIQVPANTATGTYKGSITVTANKKYSLQIALTVIDKMLPSPQDWKFRLDFWQHPAAIARVHNVPLWSEAHFDLMRKYYAMLANAGQKTITASIVNEPWGHQTYDDYPGLIRWAKKKNGEWSYDYTLFDRYISFVMSCGISERINCYSMIPWKIAFTYYDEALQKDTVFTDAVGTPAYNMFWTTMLKDFTQHLKKKNWFEITAIAMDERPMEAMKSVIALLKSIDKDWKISLAGEYHQEIETDIDDYCIASEWQFPGEVLKSRKQQGKKSTWYTCCVEKYPNGFTFSPPDEGVWISWYTAAKGMDGYLRWAYNSWPRDPLKDSRFTAWPAGDTYQVYPGPLSSVRFEKLIEGIQDFEKIQTLRATYKGSNDTLRLNNLEAVLHTFKIENLAVETAQQMVERSKNILNDLVPRRGIEPLIHP